MLSGVKGFQHGVTSLHYNSRRFATVVVGGSSKNHGGGSLPGKRRGPKVTGNQLVYPGFLLVNQRWWLPAEQLWHGGFNVARGAKGGMNSMVKGRVLYYYDTNTKRKYVSVVPEGEDPRDYMRPYYPPHEIYKMVRKRTYMRCKLDSSVNVHKKNKEMNEVRKTQIDFLKKMESIPMELVLDHEHDVRFKDTSFRQLVETADTLSEVQPAFETEQLAYCLNNKLKFDKKPANE